MSLKDAFQYVLNRTSLFTDGDVALEARDGNLHLTCQLVSLDRLACAFTRLALEVDNLQGRPIADLKQIAERLSSRLTYLLEPISPIETDAMGCVVQLRSNPPQKDSDRTTYYELLVANSGEISLCRFTRTPGQARQSIPAELTREVLLRLAADFAAVAV